MGQVEVLPSARYVRRALDFLSAANRALAEASDEPSLLEHICGVAVDVGGYRFAWVGYAQRDAQKSVRFMACAGHDPSYLDRIRITWSDEQSGQGPAGIAIRTGQYSIIQNIHVNAQFKPWLQPALEYGYESAIALPLSWQGDNFGVLAVLAAEPDAFDPDEARLLAELATMLAYGIQAIREAAKRARIEQQLQLEHDTQQTLSRILRLSLEDISLAEKLDRTLELLFDVTWLSLERKGSVFLVDNSGQNLRLVSRRYLAPSLQEKCAIVPFGHCLCGRAAQAGELQFHSHVDHDHDTEVEGMQDHGHYCQPIRSSRGLIGLLNLYVGAGHRPKPLEGPFLAAVADTLAGVIEREQMERARQRLVATLEASPDLVTITDPGGRCLYVNQGARGLFAMAETNGIGTQILDLYPEAAARRLREEAYPNAIAAGIWEGELTLKRPDGSDLPVSQLVLAHHDVQGQVAFLSTVARDISDRKRAEESAQAAALREKKYANVIINNLPGIFYLLDRDLRFLRWNGNLETVLGYPANRLLTMRLSDVVPPAEWPDIEHAWRDLLERGSASVEASLVARDGRTIPFHIYGARIDGGEGGATIVGMGIDISYRKQLEQELRTRAITDPLTGVYNRLKIEETLETEMHRAARYGTSFAVGMFDLDHFKRINDTYGHATGDEVLKDVTTLARMYLRDVDLLARWGGEEFMIIAPHSTVDDMSRLMERLCKVVANHPFDNIGPITISAGVGEYRSGERLKDFVKRVDEALYLAKNSGRNQVQAAE